VSDIVKYARTFGSIVDDWTNPDDTPEKVQKFVFRYLCIGISVFCVGAGLKPAPTSVIEKVAEGLI